MYIVKKPFLALLLSAFFFSSTAQPAVSDLVNFFKNPKTVKKMAVAGAASLGLSLLYPHIGRNAGDRCVMAFIATTLSGIGWLRNVLTLRRLGTSGVIDALGMSPSERSDEDSQALISYMKKYKFPDEDALRSHLKDQCEMFFAFALFYWSQFCVGSYWLSNVEHEEILRPSIMLIIKILKSTMLFLIQKRVF